MDDRGDSVSAARILTPEQSSSIPELRAEGVSDVQIGRIYGCSSATIRNEAGKRGDIKWLPKHRRITQDYSSFRLDSPMVQRRLRAG